MVINTSPKSFFKLLYIVLFLLSSPAIAEQVQVSVDRNPVAINDSFQLLFTADSSVDGEPNFAPLQQDFDILKQQKSSQSSWVNGNSSSTVKWSLTVMAKHTGVLTIPAIEFGDDQSQPLVLNIVQQTTADAAENSDLFLDVKLSADQVYVQAQVIYTVRLFQRINMSQATLSEPSLERAVVEKIGDDKQFNTQINGVNYLVTERLYAIFPQKSGDLTFEPLVLKADVISGQNSRSRMGSFFNRQSTQTKRITSKVLSLSVLPIPKSFTGQHWLPAEKLELTESWSNNDLIAKIGEPITRTITLKARGLTASKLPEIIMVENQQGLKIYPDKAIMADQENDNGIHAVREQKIAIIPSSGSSFTVQKIEIPWFNTITKKMDVAILPAKTITVSVDSSNTLIKPPQQIPTYDTHQQYASNIDSEIKTNSTVNLWFYLSILLAVAWLITGYLLYKTKIENKREALSNKPVKNHLKDNIKTIKLACLENNPKKTLQAVLLWCKQHHNTAGINDIIAISNQPLINEIQALNRHLYAQQNTGDWDGAAFLQAFEESLLIQKQATKDKEILEPLYPV